MKRQRRQLSKRIKSPFFQAWGAWSHTFGQEFEHILILASARSGSTLLAHILTSNPEIMGMGESKITFANTADYRQLTGKNLYFQRRNHLPKSGQERYILDKLVHNYLLHPHDISLLNDPHVRVIFLLREPAPTINSFMRALKVDETTALDYFVGRMDILGQYAQGLADGKSAVFVNFEELLRCTAPVLNMLQDYLQLSQPLSEQYEVNRTTGAFGLGDKSENIKSGRIVSPTQSPAHNLQPQTLTSAQEAYEQCATLLNKSCRHLPPGSCKD